MIIFKLVKRELLLIRKVRMTQTCAISGTRGSSGFASVSKEQIDSRTYFENHQGIQNEFNFFQLNIYKTQIFIIITILYLGNSQSR